MRWFVGLLVCLLSSSWSVAQDFEETTNTRVEDQEFKGGYTKEELDALRAIGKEQADIMKKFMEGRYSSAKGQGGRYSGILEYHDNNFDGITEHDLQNPNAAEGSGDLVGLGQKGLSSDERRKQMVIQRIQSSDNCSLSKKDEDYIKNGNFASVTGILNGSSKTEPEVADEILGSGWKQYATIVDGQIQWFQDDPNNPNPTKKEKADELEKLFNTQKYALGYIDEYESDGRTPTGKYNQKCPNVSAIVLDRGSAHGAESGAGHRVYELNEKTFKAGYDNDVYGTSATGEAANVADEYASQVKDDARRSTIPPEVRAAAQARGLDVYTKDDGMTLVTVDENGRVEERPFAAGFDELKSEFAWLEEQKKFRLNQTWKSLRAERFLKGDNYDPANVSSEFGSLYAKNSSLTEDEKDKIIAERVAEHNAYSTTSVCLAVNNDSTLNPPQACPENFTSAKIGPLKNNKGLGEICPNNNGGSVGPCVLKVLAEVVRQPWVIAKMGGISANDASQRALAAAKTQASKDPDEIARIRDEKAYLTRKGQECMKADKWCKKVTTTPYCSSTGPNQYKLTDKGKKENFNLADCKYGTAFLEVNGDPGNAFKDTRELLALQNEKAMDGPLSEFMNTVTSADFNAGLDSKTKNNPYGTARKQWQKLMDMAKEAKQERQRLYQLCMDRSNGSPQCEQQLTDANFSERQMNVMDLFGRNPDRDAKSTGTKAVNIDQSTLTRPSTEKIPNSSTGFAGATQAPTTPLPARGTAPRAPASTFRQ